MSAIPALFNYEDLQQAPDDGQRYEILSGELIVSPSPLFNHQLVVNRLNVLLATYIWQRRLGEVIMAPMDVVLSPYTVVQPDVLFIATEHQDRIRRRGVHGAPDLVVEVIAQGSLARDVVRKAALYADAGIPEYWTVDYRQRSVVMRTLVTGRYAVVTGTATTARSMLLPDFTVNTDQLFADLAPDQDE